jgi:serine/threonine protein kinase
VCLCVCVCVCSHVSVSVSVSVCSSLIFLFIYFSQAPEMLRDEPISEKVDLYWFGIMLWEMFTGKLPWSDKVSVSVSVSVSVCVVCVCVCVCVCVRVCGLTRYTTTCLHTQAAYTISCRPHTRLHAYTHIPKPPILLDYCICLLLPHKCPQTNHCITAT